MKRLVRYLSQSVAALALTVFLMSSCTKDDVVPEMVADKEYTIALQVLGSNNEAADYLVKTDDLVDGVITSTGQGIEQTGWRYFAQVNNSVFSIGYYADNNAIAYRKNSVGNLVEHGRFVFEKTLDILAPAGNNTLLAMEVPRAGLNNRILHVIDVDNVSIQRKVETNIYKPQGDSLVKWPTAMVVRGEKLFISFYPLSPSGNFTTPDVDTAQVAVFSYPGLVFEKVIHDTRTSPIGIYGNASGIITAENGDMYTFSSSSLAGGFTKRTKPSGILRIKNGQTEFDPNYFLNIEEATQGGKIVYFAPAGNGKAVARIVVDDSVRWGAFSVRNPICKLVIIDLEAATVTDVSGVPLHGGQYATPSLIENGKVYLNITTATDAHIYEIDPSTATSVKGAVIDGLEAKGIFNLN
jgi:hypothetical protein